MTRIKVCGITSFEDAMMCVDAGVDAIGFIFAPSRRRIGPDKAESILRRLPPFVEPVAVFVDTPPEDMIAICRRCGFGTIQLHGNESPELCRQVFDCGFRIIKRIHVGPNDTLFTIKSRMQAYFVQGYLLDPGAGDGKPFQWSRFTGLHGPIIVAGGLNPENVDQCLRVLHPYAIDVASGVESSPGKKDAGKLNKFVKRVRQYDETFTGS